MWALWKPLLRNVFHFNYLHLSCTRHCPRNIVANQMLWSLDASILMGGRQADGPSYTALYCSTLCCTDSDLSCQAVGIEVMQRKTHAAVYLRWARRPLWRGMKERAPDEEGRVGALVESRRKSAPGGGMASAKARKWDCAGHPGRRGGGPCGWRAMKGPC